MRCPFCSNTTHTVVETRHGEQSIERRRRCKKCFNTWCTSERIVDSSEEIMKIQRAYKQALKEQRKRLQEGQDHEQVH